MSENNVTDTLHERTLPSLTDSTVTTAQRDRPFSQAGVAIGLTVIFLLVAFVGLLLRKSTKGSRGKTLKSDTVITQTTINESVYEKSTTLPITNDNLDIERDAVVSFPIYSKIRTVKPTEDISTTTINEPPDEPYVIDLSSVDQQCGADPTAGLDSDSYEMCDMGPYENTIDLHQSNDNPYELYEPTVSGQYHQIDPENDSHDSNDYSTISNRVLDDATSDDYSVIKMTNSDGS